MIPPSFPTTTLHGLLCTTYRGFAIAYHKLRLAGVRTEACGVTNRSSHQVDTRYMCYFVHQTRLNIFLLHCNDISRASLMRLLILCAPGTYRISKVGAFVVYLSIVAHCECVRRESLLCTWDAKGLTYIKPRNKTGTVYDQLEVPVGKVLIR